MDYNIKVGDEVFAEGKVRGVISNVEKWENGNIYFCISLDNDVDITPELKVCNRNASELLLELVDNDVTDVSNYKINKLWYAESKLKKIGKYVRVIDWGD